MTTDARRALLLSGSTRVGSTNTAVLRTLASMAPPWVTAVLYAGLSALPAFNSDDSASGLPRVDELLHDIRAADIVVICTPEYAGSLPGSFKNLLDWTVGGGELYGKPVAWVNAANPGRGDSAMAELEVVLGYVGAEIVESACARMTVDRSEIGDDGIIGGPVVHAGIAEIWTALAPMCDRTVSAADLLCTAPACRRS